MPLDRSLPSLHSLTMLMASWGSRVYGGRRHDAGGMGAVLWCAKTTQGGGKTMVRWMTYSARWGRFAGSSTTTISPDWRQRKRASGEMAEYFQKLREADDKGLFMPGQIEDVVMRATWGLRLPGASPACGPGVRLSTYSHRG